jgi:hypothetical protein
MEAVGQNIWCSSHNSGGCWCTQTYGWGLLGQNYTNSPAQRMNKRATYRVSNSGIKIEIHLVQFSCILAKAS